MREGTCCWGLEERVGFRVLGDKLWGMRIPENMAISRLGGWPGGWRHLTGRLQVRHVGHSCVTEVHSVIQSLSALLRSVTKGERQR